METLEQVLSKSPEIQETRYLIDEPDRIREERRKTIEKVDRIVEYLKRQNKTTGIASPITACLLERWKELQEELRG